MNDLLAGRGPRESIQARGNIRRDNESVRQLRELGFELDTTGRNMIRLRKKLTSSQVGNLVSAVFGRSEPVKLLGQLTAFTRKLEILKADYKDLLII